MSLPPPRWLRWLGLLLLSGSFVAAIWGQHEARLGQVEREAVERLARHINLQEAEQARLQPIWSRLEAQGALLRASPEQLSEWLQNWARHWQRPAFRIHQIKLIPANHSIDITTESPSDQDQLEFLQSLLLALPAWVEPSACEMYRDPPEATRPSIKLACRLSWTRIPTPPDNTLSSAPSIAWPITSLPHERLVNLETLFLSPAERAAHQKPAGHNSSAALPVPAPQRARNWIERSDGMRLSWTPERPAPSALTAPNSHE